jgi:uncharacterized protein YukE
MAGQVRADTEAIQELGSRLEAAAEDVGAALGEFFGSAEDVADAFGVLTESAETLAAYQGTLEDTVAALRGVQAHFLEMGRGLRDNARTYGETETGHVAGFGGGAGR